MKKEVTRMFEIGEFIVYGHKGICKVEDITYLDMSGADKDRLYYVLNPGEYERRQGILTCGQRKS